MSEWLTDKEKRLLFSALTREKKVCAEVDRESCREPYEESLVSVVESLEHKFYYDRLFKKMGKQIRADAIDEFEKIFKGFFTKQNNPNSKFRPSIVMMEEDALNILEQLKEN